MRDGDVQSNEKIEEALMQVRESLNALHWSKGLTRDEIHDAIPDFPSVLYLHLPAAKRMSSSHEVATYIATPRAHSGSVEDLSYRAETETERDGGPSAWGHDPIHSAINGVGESSNAMDTQGLEVGNDEGSAETSR